MRIRGTKLDRILRLFVAGVVFFSFSGTALADQFDDQINALKAQVAAQQAQLNSLKAQSDTLQNKVDSFNAQIAATSAQLRLSRARYAKISADLNEAEKKLAAKKAILDENVRTIYMEGQVTPIEILASSDSLSEYFDRQQYLESLKESIQTAINEIAVIKAQLEKERKQLDVIIGEQQVLEDSLESQRNEVAALLEQTQGDEALYQNQMAANNQKINQLRAQQAAAIAAASHRVSGGSGCGGYPAKWCNAPMNTYVDSWGMYSRQCVSYTAWAVSERFGKYMPYWGGRGNANQWPANADRAGIPRDGNPRVGDVAIYMGGPYGHAMIVEQVKSSTVIVSNFNADNTGHYSIDEWPTSSLTFIHF